MTPARWAVSNYKPPVFGQIKRGRGQDLRPAAARAFPNDGGKLAMIYFRLLKGGVMSVEEVLAEDSQGVLKSQ